MSDDAAFNLTLCRAYLSLLKENMELGFKAASFVLAATIFCSHINADEPFIKIATTSPTGYILPPKFAFEHAWIPYHNPDDLHSNTKELLKPRLADFWVPSAVDIVAADKCFLEYIKSEYIDSKAPGIVQLAHRLKSITPSFDQYAKQYSGVSNDGRKAVLCVYAYHSRVDPSRECLYAPCRADQTIFFYYDPVKDNAIGLSLVGYALVHDLESPNQFARDAAAKTLRQTYVPPARTIWDDVLSQITPGMNQASIEKVLLPNYANSDGWINRGGVGSLWYRLDEYWRLECTMDFVKDQLLRVQLIEAPSNFQIRPPRKFTGVWTTYYANGQPSEKTGYENGTIYGDDTCYFSSGSTLRSRHYDLLGAQGESIDYYSSGKIGSRVYFKNSKPTGVWTWYREDGTISSTEDHTKRSDN